MVIILLILLIFIAILLFRTVRFVPLDEGEYDEFHIELDEEGILARFTDMIRCRTVSYQDTSLEDKEEFEKFRRLLVREIS